MSVAERTTPALEGATPTTDLAPHRKKRVKIKHLYLVRDLENARAMGLAVVSICGRNVAKPMPPSRQNNLEVVGCLMPITTERDCKHCVRGYEAILRRDFEAAR